MRRTIDIAVEHLADVHGFEIIEQIESDEPGQVREATLRGWVDNDGDSDVAGRSSHVGRLRDSAP